MSIRQGLLALLAERPMHGYQLRQEFESRTGGTWPLNIGQVYTTLQRLERDGLVEPTGDDAADASTSYRLTGPGDAEVAAWWTTPVSRRSPARDELAIKLALAVTVPGVDVAQVVQRQRTETLRSLQELTRLKRVGEREGGAAAAGDAAGAAGGPGACDLAWGLVLDNLVFGAEAEIRWLDHVEARVARVAQTTRATPPAAEASTARTDAARTDAVARTEQQVTR